MKRAVKSKNNPHMPFFSPVERATRVHAASISSRSYTRNPPTEAVLPPGPTGNEAEAFVGALLVLKLRYAGAKARPGRI
jgi:hypothetical protein